MFPKNYRGKNVNALEDRMSNMKVDILEMHSQTVMEKNTNILTYES